MAKAQTVFALGIVAFGAFVLEESLKLPYFVETVPGPGFLPFWLSIMIIGIGLTLTVGGVRAGSPASGAIPWPDARGRGRVAVVLVSLFAALVLLEPLGFFAVCVLFVAVVAFGLGIHSWRVLLPVPLLSALVLNQVFAIWLKVPLPKGILTFLG